MFVISTRQYNDLVAENGMESFVPDESFQFSAAVGWSVASGAFQASFLVKILKDVAPPRPRMRPGRPQKPQPSPLQRWTGTSHQKHTNQCHFGGLNTLTSVYWCITEKPQISHFWLLHFAIFWLDNWNCAEVPKCSLHSQILTHEFSRNLKNVL